MENDIFEYLKSLISKEYLINLTKIKEEFKDTEIFKLSLDAQNHYETLPKEVPEYMLYFVKNIIDNIISILKEKNQKPIFKDGRYLEIVVSYLFKIINSKFNFFPSHKLVFLIYYYLSKYKRKYSTLKNEIKNISNILNDDLCSCFEYFLEKINPESNIILDRKNELEENINCIIELMNANETYEKAPYLMFFEKFLYCEIEMQYFYILIIKYLKQLFNNIDINNKICIYSLLDYLQINKNKDKSIEEVSKIFKEITNNNKSLTNINVKNILIYSLKLLKSNYVLEIKEIAKEIKESDKNPEVANIFNDNEKYYEDLQKELYHIIFNINNPLPIISKYPEEKIQWCIIIKILDILLDDDIIKNSYIKILIHNIVQLFKEKLDYLTEKDFILNTFQFLFNVIFYSKRNNLLYPELLFLLTNNQDIYTIFLDTENDEIFYSNIEKNILNGISSTSIKSVNIESIKKFKFEKTFCSIITEILRNKIDYINELNIVKLYKTYINISLSYANNEIEYIIYKLYLFYNKNTNIEDYNYNFLDLNINIKKYNDEDTIEKYMNDILKEEEFLGLIKEIICSKVMEEAYSIIHEKDENENVKKKDEKYDILKYYKDFCTEYLNKYINNDLFILMPLSKNFKAFTFRFLKIIINTENVEFKKGEQDLDEQSKKILMKAYLTFIIIHEINHLIKRVNKIGIDSEKSATPRGEEGGKELIELLFGHHLLNQNINMEQAKYILELNNWKKGLTEFHRGYNNTIEKTKGRSIAFLYTGQSEICYNGFLK